MNIQELAQVLGATSVEYARGDEEISIAAAIEEATSGSVSFVGNPLYEKFLATTKATAVIVNEYMVSPVRTDGLRPVLIRVRNPHEAFGKALAILTKGAELVAEGIHASAVIEDAVVIGGNPRIGSHVFIGARTTVGERATIMPGAYIGPDSKLANDVIIHPNAVVYDHSVIGNRVVVGAGSVVGFDGFGYVLLPDGSYRKIPQTGNVVLEDDVEIGANVTIDRATIAETRIRKGAKLDNLIQIAHNVEVGENTVMAAQSGVSGSTKIGKSNIYGGQVGLTGHIETADNVIIGAQSGVSKSLNKPGTYFGSPAKGYRDALKIEGALRSLPELIARVKKLEEILASEVES